MGTKIRGSLPSYDYQAITNIDFFQIEGLLL